jgi:hypothetical protein
MRVRFKNVGRGGQAATPVFASMNLNPMRCVT